MNLRTLIQQLQAIEAEHGPDLEVVLEYDGGHADTHVVRVEPLIESWYTGDLQEGALVAVIG